MMEHTPIKFRILEYLGDNPDSWTQDIVAQLQKEYGMENEHGGAMINYDTIELVSAGLVSEGESRIDEEGVFKKGGLVTCYKLTNLGCEYLGDLKTKVIPKEA